MNVMRRKLVFSILSIQLLLSGCAQRDNRFDPSSPLHVDIPPQLKVSCNFGSAPVLKSISDSEFIVRPHTKVMFKAGGFEAESEKPIPVNIKIIQNGEIKNIKQNVTEAEIDLGDSGRTEILFETIDATGLSTVKKYVFDIQQYKKPVITLFKTESDTIRIGKTVDAVFVSKISDPDTMLDSMKFIWGVSQVLTKNVANTDTLETDSSHIQIMSSTEGTTYMSLVVIDKSGRTDTSSIPIVSNLRGKIGNLIPPIIDSIGFQYQGPDSNMLCFRPVVTVYNGDVAKAKYTWSFGGDVIIESNPCKKFSVPGINKVVLTVEDQEGAIASDSVEVFIPVLQKKPLKIYKLIAKPDSGCMPLRVEFQVFLPVGADPRDVSAVVWRFGDGPSKTGDLRAIHTYNWPGDYFVKVILSSNGGNDTIGDTIHVFSYIQFNYMAPPVMPGQKAAFWITGLNKQNVKVYWTFPDTQFSARLKDTCFVAFHRDGENIIKVEVIPDGGELFDRYTLQSMVYLVGRWWEPPKTN
jgi:hypothetical protein